MPECGRDNHWFFVFGLALMRWGVTGISDYDTVFVDMRENCSALTCPAAGPGGARLWVVQLWLSKYI